jgi:hypothetical protein
MLKRRHWNVTEETHCVLCFARAYEDIMHLFFECNFSQRVWIYLQIDWMQGQDIQTAASRARVGFAKPFFMEVVILSCEKLEDFPEAFFSRMEEGFYP